MAQAPVWKKKKIGPAIAVFCGWAWDFDPIDRGPYPFFRANGPRSADL